MVLRYWGERGLTAESFSHLVDRSAAGIRTDALLGELRSRGWTAAALAGTDEAIDAELRRGRPGSHADRGSSRAFHYIVIVASTSADAVVFHDPARAPLRVVGRGSSSGAGSRRSGGWPLSSLVSASARPVRRASALAVGGLLRAS